ncbi:DsbC family protein [Nitrogeniibacter mangrovi]|uniref:Thiol:disulfide interchange protein n=1 Tax=Nitrogeniibacter mangrovi TaxID=2016596 RepID=A0A6C1B582_9RHOO|nr:DsbC family protein [Nitrogeniibacter mangrovi]QID18852.1 DsbC family protein [Nitrogeniibacter mangrovi]
MKLNPLRAALAALALVTLTAHAGEAEVKQKMEKFLGAPAVSSVKATPYAGMYEVVLDSGELVYTDENVDYVFAGNIIDAATRKNLTQARKNELNTIDFASLPLKQAVKHVRGKGERVIATFEDPNCGFCKRLAGELQSLDNVTIYTFLYPILSADSTHKSKQIWCSENPGVAWIDWIADGIKPTASPDCDTQAIDANVKLGAKLRVGGTPTIFLSDGTRIGGYVSADHLEAAIAKAEAKRKQ